MRIISGAAVANERVVVRVGFDLPLDAAGNIAEGGDLRIEAGLPTLNWLREKGASLVLLNHFGRPTEPSPKYSNQRVAQVLSRHLGGPVQTSPEVAGPTVTAQAEALKAKEILLVENVRFDPREKQNDPAFARQLAALGSLYVNDAFSAAYNRHASLVGITEFLPSYAGLLLAEEILMMDRVLITPDRPLAVILGGAKIDTKIGVIERFLQEADAVLLGGALANTILHLKGMAIGKSRVDLKAIAGVKDLVLTNPKLHIPVDAIVSADPSGQAPTRVAPIGRLADDEMILDIGPETEALFDAVIQKAKMVVWNGPLGRVEAAPFQHGTLALVNSIKRAGAFALTGGGDSLAFLANHGLMPAFNYISTGGGTMLAYLSGKKLPAIEKLR